ncbi:glycosyltransferase [Actinoplanes derwentensis]|uniref:glycosyltransferase n=1 Tax=Actinoplanes derwentensis TaxID=113562 RepID=UPI000B818EED|nr:nucleotide disphospho-sugar-binding domain-containing protein [Actinoplanes derwentensis]
MIPELADWSLRRPLIGALRMPPEQRSLISADHGDQELDRWLDDGDPPVYVGFGSQPFLDGHRLIGAIRDTATWLGVRVLLNAGWSHLEPADLGDRILLRGSVDHERIFPRCSAAVHHGGAGSTAASIGAGLPTIICADYGDRALWGQVITRLGAGSTMSFAEIGAAPLIAAIKPLLSGEAAGRARAIAARMRTEHAAERAIAVVERHERL